MPKNEKPRFASGRPIPAAKIPPPPPPPRPRRGFTLIEVMIAIAVIAAILAIALPSLLRSRIGANEARAIGFLRAYATGAEQYRAFHGVYPEGGEAFGGDPPFIERPGPEEIGPDCCKAGTGNACPVVGRGYRFISLRTSSYPSAGPRAEGFQAYAWPEVFERTGRRSFYADESGILRAGILPPFDDCEIADPADESEEKAFRLLNPLE